MQTPSGRHLRSFSERSFGEHDEGEFDRRVRTDEQWREQLAPWPYAVCRGSATVRLAAKFSASAPVFEAGEHVDDARMHPVEVKRARCAGARDSRPPEAGGRCCLNSAVLDYVPETGE
jgi:hypothetical protein